MHMALFHSSSPEAVCVGLGILVLIWIVSRYGRNTSRGKFPPGPRPWPLVGNLGHLGTLPHRNLAYLAKRYGPLMFLRLGSIPTLVVSSSSMAKEFLKTHDLVFADRHSCAVGRYVFYDHKDVGLSPYGEYWRHIKKLCTVELLTVKRVDSFECVREEELSAMIRSLSEQSGRGMHAVDVTRALSSMSLNIICKMFSGRTYSEAEFGGGREFKEMVDEFFVLAGAFCIGDFIPYLDWLDLQGYHRRMKKVSKVFDGFLEKVIDEHIQRRRTSHGEQQQKGRVKDMVDVLLDSAEAEDNTPITRVSIKAIVLDMLLGGVETSSTVIEWAMSELLRNPQTLKRAQRELDSAVGRDRIVKESDLASCEYLQCVIKETFRLHPPLPLLAPRESREDCCVGEYFIPRKTRLIVNVWAMGRDESVWEDANKFRPERFVGKDMDVRGSGQNFDLLPFGSGRRICPGISAGMRVVEVTLARLLHCYDWSVEGGEVKMDEVFGLTSPRKSHLFARPAWRLTTTN